jgi:hypothetical protein
MLYYTINKKGNLKIKKAADVGSRVSNTKRYSLKTTTNMPVVLGVKQRQFIKLYKGSYVSEYKI